MTLLASIAKGLAVFAGGAMLYELGLRAKEAYASSKLESLEPTLPSTAPKPSPQPSKPMPQTSADDGPNVYKSKAEDCAPHPSGTVRVGGIEITRLPFIDRASGLFARPDTPTAKEILAAHGMRLATAEEWQRLVALCQKGDPLVTAIAPCTLVHSREDQLHMRSLAYQKKHDACVDKQLERWDGRSLVLNVGKQLLEPREKNGVLMSTNFGWWPLDKNGKPQTKPIQSPGNAHELTYTDYSHLLTGVVL